MKDTKSKAIAPYAFNFEKGIDPKKSKAFIRNPHFMNWCKFAHSKKKELSINTNWTINPLEYEDKLQRYNVNLTTGITYGSNIIAVDIDDYKTDGLWEDRANHPWIKRFGENYVNKFDTYTQKTGQGGIHLFFQYHPRIWKSKNDTELEVDIKSNGGNIVMAGSYNVAKKKYYTVLRNRKIKPMPVEVIQWIEKHIYREKLKPIKDNMKIPDEKKINLNKQIYNYDIPLEKFKKVIDRLPSSWFKDTKKWLTFITACKYLGFIDLAKEKSKPHFDSRHGDFESDFMKNWNSIKKNNINCIECIYKEYAELEKKTNKFANDLILYKYKPVPINKVKPHQTICERKLSEGLDLGDKLRNGNCYVIKSDTGTGKSYLARKTLGKLYKEHNINFISLVSRIGLADEQFKDFEKDDIMINYYKDDGLEEGMNVVSTIDSVRKFSRIQNWNNYVIFVDEINSLLSYLWTASNIKHRADKIELFEKILKNCRGFIMADADVSDRVFDYLEFVDRDNVFFIQNTHIHNENIEVYEMDSEEEMIELMRKDDKYLGCFDWKRTAEHIYEQLNDPDCVLFTGSERLGDRNYGDQPKLLQNSVCIYGQDSKLDRNVYCIFQGDGMINAEQMKQMICRERKIKKVYILFKNMKKQAPKEANTDYATYEDFVEYNKNRVDFGVKLFGETGFSQTLLDKYMLLYNKFGYYDSCLATNARLHLIKILEKNGFIIKQLKNTIKRKNISKQDEREAVEAHREELYNYEHPDVKDTITKYWNEDTYKDKEYVENMLFLWTDNLLKDVFTLRRYILIYNQSQADIKLLNKYGNEHKGVGDKIQEITKCNIDYKNAFTLEKLDNLIETKLFVINLFKTDLDYKVDEETYEVVINEKWADPKLKDIFMNSMKNLFHLKHSEECEGYPLKKDFYGMINQVFPKFYYPKQARLKGKDSKKRVMKYYYQEQKDLLRIVEDMLVKKYKTDQELREFECPLEFDASILRKAMEKPELVNYKEIEEKCKFKIIPYGKTDKSFLGLATNKTPYEITQYVIEGKLTQEECDKVLEQMKINREE